MKKDEIRQFEPAPDVSDILQQYERMGFGAKRLGQATKITEDMIRDNECNVYLAVAGAMVPAGLRGVIAECVRSGWVDALVTTGANLTHDLIEATGTRHRAGDAAADDAQLLKRGESRIYDVLMPRDAYVGVEKKLWDVFSKMGGRTHTVQELLGVIGKNIDDKNSILRACHENSVPIFCPALGDSVIGVQIWFWKQEHKLDIDAFSDRKPMLDMMYDSKRNGAFIIGGGTPKNFLFQSMEFTSKGFDYAVQITTDRPEPGGLSGAELREAISWLKIKPGAKYVDVICDATIAFPLMVSALKARMKQ